MAGDIDDPVAQKDPKSKEARVQFLIEQHYKEVDAFWTRTNMMFLVVGASATAATAILASTESFDMHIIAWLSVFAAAICALWLRINHVGIYYEDRWLKAAEEVMDSDSPWSDPYRRALDGQPSQQAKVKANLTWSATQTMYFVISLLLVAWVVIGIVAFLKAHASTSH